MTNIKFNSTYENRTCDACGKKFNTDIFELWYCDKCLSLDELMDYLHSDFVPTMKFMRTRHGFHYFKEPVNSNSEVIEGERT